jgi:hypothetical protein
VLSGPGDDRLSLFDGQQMMDNESYAWSAVYSSDASLITNPWALLGVSFTTVLSSTDTKRSDLDSGDDSDGVASEKD